MNSTHSPVEELEQMRDRTAADFLGTRYLYHGTSLAAWEAIVRAGELVPRGAAEGNWSHTVVSHEAAIYLSTAYATYFAACATREESKGVVIEIDVASLAGEQLCCDEDAYALLDLKHKHAGRHLAELVEQAKLELPTGLEYAKASLELMGNCAYLGSIPLSAVTRAVSIDWDANPELAHTALEPVISPQNFRFLGDFYIRLTHWLFDAPAEEPTKHDFFGFGSRLPRSREGLQHIYPVRD
jgi:hypothetical protein